MSASIRAKGPVDCIATVEKHHDGRKAQRTRTASDQSRFDEELCFIDCLLHTVPLEVGFVPPTWMPVTDVAILKKIGMLEIDVM